MKDSPSGSAHHQAGVSAASESEERLRTLFAYVREAIVLLDTELHRFIDVNPSAERLFGLNREALLELGPLGLSPENQPSGPSAEMSQAWIAEAVAGGDPTFEWWHLNAAGDRFPCEVHLVRMPWGDRHVIRGSIGDLSDQKLLEMSELGRRRILDNIARGGTLQEALVLLIRTVEDLLPGMICSVLLLDDEQRLRMGAAPSLPDFYNDAVDGLVIGPLVGSCGSAAFTANRVIVSDIATHPNWEGFQQLACQAEVRACWSEPIRSLFGKVLGTFAMYYREPMAPAPVELRIIEAAAGMAAAAIEHARSQDLLVRINEDLEVRVAEETKHLAEANRKLQASEEESRLAAVAFNTHDSIVITDTHGKILRVNNSFTQLTGYSPEEVIGQTPRLLRSGKHDDDFYRDMWRTIRTVGYWDGEVWNRRKDGGLYLQRLTIACVKNAAGKTTHYVGDGRDITIEKQATADHAAIMAARTVQRTLFPAVAPCMPGFEIAGAAYPADDVSGDCFDFIPLGQQCMGVLIADVSGHGLASALLMARTQAHLNALAEFCSDPGELLIRTNRLFWGNDSGHFVTMFLLNLCSETRSFTYAGAGHQGCLLRKNGDRETLESTGLPVGVLPDLVLAAPPATKLHSGDMIVLTTDGIEEACRPDGVAFGRQQLLDVVCLNREQSAEHIVRALCAAAVDYAGGRRQIDDMTAVVVKAL